MNSNEIYKRFLLKLNRNDTNEGINILPSVFVLLFNTEADTQVTDEIVKNGDNAKLDRLDILLESDVKLPFVKKFSDSVEFQLPDTFWRHASSYVIVNKGNCKNVKIYNFDKKALGFTGIQADKLSRPSFDFEETHFILTKNKMKVYFDDFEIVSCFSSHYRRPIPIDIVGYTRFDGSASTNIPSELPDDIIDKVLDRLVLEVNRQFKDQEGVALGKEKIATQP